jgi:hypothetical protein
VYVGKGNTFSGAESRASTIVYFVVLPEGPELLLLQSAVEEQMGPSLGQLKFWTAVSRREPRLKHIVGVT